MASILVIDGDPDGRDLHQESLELDGHRVATAADGIEALTGASSAPDLIVCDIDLPEVDGWAVLERLKTNEDPDVSGIPVLLVSSHTSESEEIRAGIEGAICFLVKPLSPGQLRDAVIGVLSGGPEIQQRRRVQVAALERLARQESGRDPDGAPRVHLTRLERLGQEPSSERAPVARHFDLKVLTEKQVTLLDALRQAPSVSAAAETLGVSRSNIYASLRRISRKLDVGSVQTLLHLLRTDQLAG